MYEIKVIGGKWQVHTQGQGAYEGSFLQIATLCINRLGFSYEDFKEGVEEMTWNDHDTAHFGIYKSFIYSYDSNKKRKVA
jgi:hypothetical protein